MDRHGEPTSPELALVDPELRARLLAAESAKPEPARRRMHLPASVVTLMVFALAGTGAELLADPRTAELYLGGAASSAA